MALLDKLPIQCAVNVTHWENFRPGSFRNQFTIQHQDGTSFWVGVVLNGRKPEWGRVRLDFNPNKVAKHTAFQTVLQFMMHNTRPMHRRIRRFDLAVDIPVLRSNVFLVKDNRAYIERRRGQEWTQYLGAKSSSVGRVKLYNKQIEAHLSQPLTRLELTLDPETPFEKLAFPSTYYLNDYQMCFDEVKATDTERFILNALLQGCGSLTDLGRKTRAKIESLLNLYVKRIQITPQDYATILAQLYTYTNGTAQTPATDADQPPAPPPPPLPAWVEDAEQAEQSELPWPL
jgi:hypothetical protein